MPWTIVLPCARRKGTPTQVRPGPQRASARAGAPWLSALAGTHWLEHTGSDTLAWTHWLEHTGQDAPCARCSRFPTCDPAAFATWRGPVDQTGRPEDAVDAGRGGDDKWSPASGKPL